MSLGDALMFRVGIDARDVETGLKAIGRRAATIGTAALVSGFAAVTAGAIALGRGVLTAASEMEVAESRLVTLMHSSDDAHARLKVLADFAAATPFELDQIVAAEVTLRGFGAAAEEILPGLIDVSAATGAEMSQMAIDFGKAWNRGAVAMESDVGRMIRGQIEMAAGVDATTMSLDEFRGALLDTLNSGMYAGGAAKLAKTFTGMVSTLKDEWAGFQRQVGDAGVFDKVKGVLEVTLRLIGEHREEIGNLAETTSTALWSSFRAVAEVIGVVATGAQAIDLALRSGAGAAASLHSELVRATEPARQLAINLAAAAGDDALVGRLMGANAQLHAGAEASRAFAEEQGRIVGAAMAAETPLDTIRGLLAEADALAASTADEVAGIGSGKKPTGEVASKGKDPFADMGGWEAEIQAELDAGKAFYAEIMALDDTATQRAIANMDARLAENQAHLAAGSISFAEAMDAEMAIRMAASIDIGMIEFEEADRRAKAHADALKQIEDEKNARIEAVATAFGVAGDIVSAFSGLLDTENEKQKEAHKRLAIASIWIDAAAATIRQFADLPFYAALGTSAAIAIEAAAATVQVSKQHQGGIVYAHQGRFPDEYDTGSVRRLRQEATLNSQVTRALGEQGVRALNGGGAIETTVNLRVGRETQTEVIRTGLASGSPLRGEIRSAQRSGDRDYGFSGAKAVA